jgi:hypothetical protein
MKKSILLAGAVFASLMTLAPEKADAFVCARGFYRAGCVGPRGAIVARRPMYGAPVYGGWHPLYGPMYRPPVAVYRRW